MQPGFFRGSKAPRTTLTRRTHSDTTRVLVVLAIAATLVACRTGSEASRSPVPSPRSTVPDGEPYVLGSQGLVPSRAAPAGAASSSADLLTASVRNRLAAELLRLRAAHHLPGVQVVVRLADGESWNAHAGFANVATRSAVSPTTLFGTGSITKTFVAALTLQLAGEGVLGLDDPVTLWLPVFAAGRGVTVRDLLDHTSGIGEPFNNRALLGSLAANRGRTWTAAAVLRYATPPAFAPGRGWLYSNANYLLLGEILQAATGQPVATLLQRRFFGPLGLTHTFLQGQAPVPESDPVAHGYEAATDTTWTATDVTGRSRYLPFTSLATALGAAGALVSNAEDLSRWAEALYGGHVLSPAALAEMLDFGLTSNLRPRWPYGLGVQRVTLDGQTAWGHSGLLSGYHAAMRYFPGTGAVIVVLVNADATNPDTLVSGLLGALGALPPAAP